MQERERYDLAIIAAETMYNLMELGNQQDEADLDEMMRRLNDLSAYSLTHAEIMDQREGGQLSQDVPLGYYVDFTELAADYGWQRMPANNRWRHQWADINWRQFQ